MRHPGRMSSSGAVAGKPYRDQSCWFMVLAFQMTGDTGRRWKFHLISTSSTSSGFLHSTLPTRLCFKRMIADADVPLYCDDRRTWGAATTGGSPGSRQPLRGRFIRLRDEYRGINYSFPASMGLQIGSTAGQETQPAAMTLAIPSRTRWTLKFQWCLPHAGSSKRAEPFGNIRKWIWPGM